MEAMKSKVQAIFAADDTEQRETLYNGAYSIFVHYKDMGAASILEMALWKGQLKRGRNNDGTNRQVLDREECRCVCGSDVVIPSVVIFSGIDHPESASSQNDH